MYYSLFVFRFYYKIIGLSFLNVADCGLTRLWPAGMGRAGNMWAGPGQTMNGPALGLNSSLQAWAGLALKNVCGPGF